MVPDPINPARLPRGAFHLPARDAGGKGGGSSRCQKSFSSPAS